MRSITPVLTLLTAWLLRRVQRDYEMRDTLSPMTSALGWAAYSLYTGLTLYAVRRPSGTAPEDHWPATTASGFLMLSGFSLFIWGVREFRSFERMSGLENGQLVASGPYRLSRNPQVVGWGLASLGVALAGRSDRALLLTAAFFCAHRLYLPIEERHLERVFGEEYRRYRTAVPRFLGVPDAG